MIGTSTNIVVSGALKNYGLPALQMFEIAWIGIPLSFVGLGYMIAFGPKLLPNRTSVIGVLDDKQRSTPLFHILVENIRLSLASVFWIARFSIPNPAFT